MIILFLGTILLLGFAVFIAIKLLLYKRPFHKLFGSFLITILCTVLFFIYNAFYPSEAFYINEWNTNTDVNFPENAEFVWKKATFPDHHNDYNATAIIVIPQEEFKRLLAEAQSSISLKPDSFYLGYKGFLDQFLPVDHKESQKIESIFYSTIGNSFKIGFYKNGKTVVFQRHSS